MQNDEQLDAQLVKEQLKDLPVNDREKYQLREVIGKGAFGQVYRGVKEEKGSS